jgi:hypothetical protein
MTMAILKKDLQAVIRDIKALEKKLDKLLKAEEQMPKAKKVTKKKAVKKVKAVKKAPAQKAAAKKVPAKIVPAKIVPAPKAAVKKAAVKKAAVKKAPAKKAAAPKAVAKKKTTQVTATDKILQIVKRSKKGVDVPTLKEKSGFDDKKVRNIVFRAAKEGKIKKSGRGIYVGA